MPALDGIRVLDLTRAVPGPYCTMLLGDMGADVIVVEEAAPPQGRRAGAAASMPDEAAAARDPLRRNKRSIRLDLKHPDGHAILVALARRADVVVEGFRPGVAARLGIDDAALRAKNPRLVYLSLSGYGQRGPYASLVGHELDYIAMAGALSMIGRPGAPPAIPMNLLADLAAGGLMAAFSIAVALIARERTGNGQYIDHAMTDGVLSLLTRIAGQRLAGGPLPEPGRHRINGALPHYDVYACRDGKYLAVAPLEPWFHENLCAALGLTAVPEDAPAAQRDAARDALRARFLERTRDEWFARLRDRDTCVAPVLDLDEALSEPHHVARGMRVDVPHPTLGAVPMVGIGPKLTGTPGAIRSLGAPPGAHTDAVLAELGYDAAAIATLRAAVAVA
jgi:crotonobetainyl-CoA:carnitine CoA-transferase CaiB-like acyl-CoA transferase